MHENKKDIEYVILVAVDTGEDQGAGIEASLDELEFRLSRDNSTTRPLMSKNSVEELFNKRKDMYEAFKDIKVKSQMISKTVSVILKELKCYEKNLNN